MTTKEEIARLRGAIESAVSVLDSADDRLARAAHDLLVKGLVAADKVTAKRDGQRARWNEWYERNKKPPPVGPPKETEQAFGADVNGVGPSFGNGAIARAISPSLSSSGFSSFSSDPKQNGSGHMGGGAAAASAYTAPYDTVLVLTSADPKQNKRQRKGGASEPPDTADATALAAWCDRWKIDARDPDVGHMADYYRARGQSFRDWGAVLRNWKRMGSRWTPTKTRQPAPAGAPAFDIGMSAEDEARIRKETEDLGRRAK